MTQYIVTLSEAEDKALGYVAFSQQEWIDAAIHERCRLAINEIVKQEVERITSLGGSLSGTKEDIVLAAPIKSAAQQAAELSPMVEQSVIPNE